MIRVSVSKESCVSTRAVDRHLLYADPDPAVFLNPDPHPGPGLARAVDPDPHSFSLLDSDPGGKICRLKIEKCKEIADNCNFIKCFESKFSQAPLFLTFEQSFQNA